MATVSRSGVSFWLSWNCVGCQRWHLALALADVFAALFSRAASVSRMLGRPGWVGANLHRSLLSWESNGTCSLSKCRRHPAANKLPLQPMTMPLYCQHCSMRNGRRAMLQRLLYGMAMRTACCKHPQAPPSLIVWCLLTCAGMMHMHLWHWRRPLNTPLVKMRRHGCPSQSRITWSR